MSHVDPIIDKIIVARVSLLLKHPFFGNMATRLKIQEGTEWMGTAATDGRTIFFNREFFLPNQPSSTQQLQGFLGQSPVIHTAGFF